MKKDKKEEILTMPINSFDELYKEMATLNLEDQRKVLVALKTLAIKENLKRQERTAGR